MLSHQVKLGMILQICGKQSKFSWSWIVNILIGCTGKSVYSNFNHDTVLYCEECKVK